MTTINSARALFLLFVLLTACRTRTASNLSDLSPDEPDPKREHPCSIANNPSPFQSGPYPTVADRAFELNKRDLSMVQSAALLSRLAYETPQKIQQIAKAWGYKTIDVTVDGPMQAFVASNDNCVVLSFRGTDMTSLRDWFVDLSASRRAVDGGLMHAGFLRAYKSMSDRLAIHLSAQHARTKTLWVTGHSLGGALAGVFAYTNDFSESPRTLPIEHVITFGQPLFVDAALAKKLRIQFFNRYLRIVNNVDIVARIPPWFAHFGHLLWFKPDGSEYIPDLRVYGGGGGQGGADVVPASIPDDLSPNQEAFDQFMAATAPAPADQPVIYGGPRMTDDHSMDLYLNRISQKWSALR